MVGVVPGVVVPSFGAVVPSFGVVVPSSAAEVPSSGEEVVVAEGAGACLFWFLLLQMTSWVFIDTLFKGFFWNILPNLNSIA